MIQYINSNDNNSSHKQSTWADDSNILTAITITIHINSQPEQMIQYINNNNNNYSYKQSTWTDDSIY